MSSPDFNGDAGEGVRRCSGCKWTCSDPGRPCTNCGLFRRAYVERVERNDAEHLTSANELNHLDEVEDDDPLVRESGERGATIGRDRTIDGGRRKCARPGGELEAAQCRWCAVDYGDAGVDCLSQRQGDDLIIPSGARDIADVWLCGLSGRGGYLTYRRRTRLCGCLLEQGAPQNILPARRCRECGRDLVCALSGGDGACDRDLGGYDLCGGRCRQKRQLSEFGRKRVRRESRRAWHWLA